MITRYEIAAEKNGKRFFVTFTARRTKTCLINNVRNRASDIVAAIEADPEAICFKANRDEVIMSDGTRVFYTGKTEGDYIRESAS